MNTENLKITHVSIDGNYLAVDWELDEKENGYWIPIKLLVRLWLNAVEKQDEKEQDVAVESVKRIINNK